MMADRTSNPGLYRRLCEPHESVETANAAMRAFVEAVSVLREQHRIPDLVVICEVVATSCGREFLSQVGMEWGDVNHHEMMVARTLGQIQGDRQKRISDALREQAIMDIHDHGQHDHGQPDFWCRVCGKSTNTGGRYYGCCWQCWQDGLAAAVQESDGPLAAEGAGAVTSVPIPVPTGAG